MSSKKQIIKHFVDMNAFVAFVFLLTIFIYHKSSHTNSEFLFHLKNCLKSALYLLLSGNGFLIFGHSVEFLIFKIKDKCK